MAIQIFLNEHSLKDIDPSQSDFNQSITRILTCIRDIKAHGFGGVEILKLRDICNTEFENKETLSTIINTKTHKEIKTQLSKLLFDECLNWDDNQKHDCDKYYIYDYGLSDGSKNDCMNYGSIAELGERCYTHSLEFFGTLLSFSPSHFDDRDSITIKKEPDIPIGIENYLNTNCLNKLEQIYHSRIYQGDCKDAPQDHQTCLNNKDRFKETTYINQGRKVFQEKTTRVYFAVDNFHVGHSAHLEAWDRRKKHLGEADIISGKIDLSKFDPGKNYPF